MDRPETTQCSLCGGELEYKCDMAQAPHHHVYGHKDEDIEKYNPCGNIEYIAQENTNGSIIKRNY